MDAIWEILTDIVVSIAIIFMVIMSAVVINYFYISFLSLTLTAFRLFLVAANLALLIAIVGEIIIDSFLVTQIDYLAGGLQTSLVLAFNVAVVVLGITYVLSAFWIKKFNLVDWKRAVAWLLGGLLFYNFAGTILSDLENMKRGAGQVIYQIFLQVESYEDNAQRSSAVFDIDPTIACRTISSNLDDTLDIFDLFLPSTSEDRYDAWGCLTNRWEDFLTYDNGIDAIDIAYAVISAGVDEDMQSLESFLPITFFDTHFGSEALLQMINLIVEMANIMADLWGEDTSVEEAFGYIFEAFFSPLQPLIVGVSKMYLAVYLAGIAIIEQTTYLVYAIAYAGVFWSFILMLPLAFFKPLEKYAMGLLKEMISLTWSFLFSQIMLALGIAILLLGAGTQIWFVINIFALCALWPVATALLTATNSLTNAIKASSAIGGKAAQAAVQSGQMLAQNVAVSKASALGNKLGISGADKAVGPDGKPKPTSGMGKLGGAIAGRLQKDMAMFGGPGGGGFAAFNAENRRAIGSMQNAGKTRVGRGLNAIDGALQGKVVKDGKVQGQKATLYGATKTKARQVRDWFKSPETKELEKAGRNLDDVEKLDSSGKLSQAQLFGETGLVSQQSGSTGKSSDKGGTPAPKGKQPIKDMPGIKSVAGAFGLNPESGGGGGTGATLGVGQIAMLNQIASSLSEIAKEIEQKKTQEAFSKGLGGT